MRIFRETLRLAFLIAILLVVVIPPYEAHSISAGCSPSRSASWQICGPYEDLGGINQQSTVIQATDGTIWLAWTHLFNGVSNIYYSTRLTNGTWINNSTITNKGGTNLFPSIVQLANGTIFIFWGYKAATAKNFQIYYQYLKGSVWSAYTKVPLRNPTTFNDTQPSAALGRDGTLWLVWTRDNSTKSAATASIHRWLMYETMNSTGWSKNEQTITSNTDPNWSFEPSVLVPTDGVPRIAFSKGNATRAIFQINYLYRSGSGWTPPIPIVTSNSTADDENPSLIQDRNGTLWVFWGRNMNTNYAVRAEYSWNNGASWRGESMLTSACSGCVDARYPSAVQSSGDKNLRVFYSTNLNSTGYDLWALVTVNPVSPVHHVSISASPGTYGSNASQVCGNYIGACDYAGGFNNPYGPIYLSPVVVFYVTVQNTGDFNETVTVALAATNTTSISLPSQTAPLLTGNSVLLAFNFNTTGVRPARYGFTANATIPGETVGNHGDGVLSKTNIVHLFPLGDIDQDGSDTLVDVGIVFYNYGFGCSSPGVCSSRYNPWADPSGQGIINIVDVGIVSRNFDIFT